MPDKTIVIKLDRLASEPVLSSTDQGSAYVYYIVPIGVAAYAGTILSPLRAGFERYTGNISGVLSTDCDITPPVDEGAPTWNAFTLPGFVPGQPYEVKLLFSYLTPASGHTITDITSPNLPEFLTIQPGDGSFVWLRGIVPAGFSGVTMELRGKQTGGLSASTIYSIIPLTASIYAYGLYDKESRLFTVLVGEDGSGVPSTQMLFYPASFGDRGVYSLNRFTTPVYKNGVAHPFWFAFSGFVTGHYDNKISWFGRDKYFTIDMIEDENFEGVLTLSDVAPTQIGDTDWAVDGDPEFVSVATTVLAVDYSFAYNSGNIGGGSGTYPAITMLVKVSGTDAIEFATQTIGPPAFALPKGAYNPHNTGDYGSGYTRQIILQGPLATTVNKLYIRRVGQTDDLLVVQLPAMPSSGNVSRTTIYPSV